jgi:hypothetical protein
MLETTGTLPHAARDKAKPVAANSFLIFNSPVQLPKNLFVVAVTVTPVGTVTPAGGKAFNNAVGAIQRR